MAKNGQYNTFNLTDPEFGIKNYAPVDPNMNVQCLYRHDRIAINQNDKPDHFTDIHAKQF
jgi:hypothetical protein